MLAVGITLTVLVTYQVRLFHSPHQAKLSHPHLCLDARTSFLDVLCQGGNFASISACPAGTPFALKFSVADTSLVLGCGQQDAQLHAYGKP